MNELLTLGDYSTKICDNEGLSPLLVATIMGHSDFVKIIIDACLASIESFDSGGRNTVHLVVIYSTLGTSKKMLGILEMTALINEHDKEGNTPLHLSTMAQKHWHVFELLSTGRVDLTTRNNDGNTALDLCLLNENLSHGKKLIQRKLESRKASRGQNRPLMRVENPPIPKTEDLRQVINTLSVVAALLATITFAAAFTIPGGYRPDDPDEGSPALIKRPALQVFLISDTIALCCSMWVLLTLIAAASNNTSLQPTIDSSKLKLAVSLYASMIAFVSGLYTVVRIESKWLAILICIIGSILSSLFLDDMIIGLLTDLIPWYEGLRQYSSSGFQRAAENLDYLMFYRM